MMGGETYRREKRKRERGEIAEERNVKKRERERKQKEEETWDFEENQKRRDREGEEGGRIDLWIGSIHPKGGSNLSKFLGWKDGEW